MFFHASFDSYGKENVMGSDVRPVEGINQFKQFDAMDPKAYEAVVKDFKPDTLIHLPALLSAVGEKYPFKALDLNVNSFQTAVKLCLDHNMMLFAPSTIAVFGKTSPKKNTPNDCILQPSTIYGMTKVFLEQTGRWFYKNRNLNFRSLRYPGVISPSEPGGGTTDYAVDIFYAALKHGKYECFLEKGTYLPMIYIDDMVKGTIQLLEAQDSALTERVYNFTGVSFNPEELANAIKKKRGNFEISYKSDFRQAIADSWPDSIDDSLARRDWGWKHDYDLDMMTEVMLKEVEKKLTQTR